MPPPIPKKKLGPSHCSVLFNDTIYAYSEEAFQSLKLEKGAEWEELPLMFGTRGAACVHGHRGTPQEALYVIGGLTSNATIIPDNGFKGLQRYIFAQQKWESILTPDHVLYNVTDHGATFLEASQDLFIFSGTRWPDPQQPSTMTFLIKTSEPFTITSIPTDKVPPLIAPLVLPWGNEGALVLGGGEQNTNLFTYSPSTGWTDLGNTLEQGLPPRGKSSATLIEGDDKSRMLLTFDMTVSPTKTTRTKVLDGDPVVNTNNGPGEAFGGEVGLTEKNWPTYDGSLAPEGPRDGVYLASEGSVVVFTGGSDEDPICIFEARENHWVNATALFLTGPTITDGEEDRGTPTTLPSSIPSTSPTSTDVPAAGGGGNGGDNGGLSTVQLLFIVLGTILGTALILGLMLFFLRRKRALREGKVGGRDYDSGGRMSFQDRGVSFMKEAGLGRRGTNANRGGAGARGGVADEPLAPPSARNRSSGWSKYFSGNSATNLVNLPSRTYNRSSSVYDTETSQRNSNSTRYPYASGASGLIPPGKSIETMGVTDPMPLKTPNSARSQGLVLDLPGTGLGVNPNHFSTKQRKEVERRTSDLSLSSAGGSSYSSGIPESIVEKEIWSPVSGSAVQNSPQGWGVLTENRASSVYPESAVTVWPDGSERRRNDNIRDSDLPDPQRMPAPYNNNKDDMSWLNLKQS